MSTNLFNRTTVCQSSSTSILGIHHSSSPIISPSTQSPISFQPHTTQHQLTSYHLPRPILFLPTMNYPNSPPQGPNTPYTPSSSHPTPPQPPHITPYTPHLPLNPPQQSLPPPPGYSIIACLVLSRTDRLRFMGFPKGVLGEVRETLKRFWMRGVQGEGEYEGVCWEFKLGGRPCESGEAVRWRGAMDVFGLNIIPSCLC